MVLKTLVRASCPDLCTIFQVQQKILARGDMSAEDEIADSVFIQVSMCLLLVYIQTLTIVMFLGL